MRWTLTLSPVSQPGDLVDALGVVNGRLAVADGDTTDLLDPATGRIIAKRRWKNQHALAVDGGLQVSSCEDKKDNAICGFDPATGAELWRSPIPESGYLPQLGESLAMADGRVYIVSLRNDTVVFHLVVFDGRTGKILGRIPITGDAEFIYGPVTDGVIAIGRGTSQTDLYAERPDIRSTRKPPS